MKWLAEFSNGIWYTKGEGTRIPTAIMRLSREHALATAKTLNSIDLQFADLEVV